MSCVWLHIHRRSLLSVATNNSVARAAASTSAAPPPPSSPPSRSNTYTPLHRSIANPIGYTLSPARSVVTRNPRVSAYWRSSRHFSLCPAAAAPGVTTSICPSQAPIRSLSSLIIHSTRPSGIRSRADPMDLNGDAGAKRKRSSITAPAERPVKHLRPESSALTPGDSTPANGTVYDVEDDEDAGRLLPVGPAQADSPEWQATIEEVVKSVVSIHFCQTCSFDTELSMSSQATGFVVDAENGYILTNRHVVCPGPFWGYCIFDNHEEVSCALSACGSFLGQEY